MSSILSKYIERVGYFSPEFCDRVISLQEHYEWQKGEVYSGHDETGYGVHEEHRKVWAISMRPDEHNQWLFDEMNAVVAELNAEAFQFDLDGDTDIVLLRYDDGCFFKPHNDGGGDKGITRKLSTVVQLSPKENYRHGETYLIDQRRTCPQELGSVFSFSALSRHMVKTVCNGTRYALIVWSHGSRGFR